MNAQEIAEQLERIASDPDFSGRSEEVVEAWMADGTGSEAIAPVLRFMEANPQIDYGMPGPLVHFVERFYRGGYEEELVDSIRRKPTPHTVWMFNRVINGTKAPDVRQNYIAELERAKERQPLDQATLERINHFLSRLASESST